MIDFDASSDPADVAAGASLTQGTRYTVQNLSTVATLFIREQAGQPAATARAFRIEAGGMFTIKSAGTPIWLWTDDPDGCPMILAEAA